LCLSIPGRDASCIYAIRVPQVLQEANIWFQDCLIAVVSQLLNPPLPHNWASGGAAENVDLPESGQDFPLNGFCIDGMLAVSHITQIVITSRNQVKSPETAVLLACANR
jgi:hypothetical protein